MLYDPEARRAELTEHYQKMSLETPDSGYFVRGVLGNLILHIATYNTKAAFFRQDKRISFYQDVCVSFGEAIDDTQIEQLIEDIRSKDPDLACNLEIGYHTEEEIEIACITTSSIDLTVSAIIAIEEMMISNIRGAVSNA